MTVINNKETLEGETAFYIDQDGQIYEAVIKKIEERDGFHYAHLEINKDGAPATVKDAPYNTSPEKHSWRHPPNPKEVALHNKPDYYGEIYSSEDDGDDLENEDENEEDEAE